MLKPLIEQNTREQTKEVAPIKVVLRPKTTQQKFFFSLDFKTMLTKD